VGRLVAGRRRLRCRGGGASTRGGGSAGGALRTSGGVSPDRLSRQPRGPTAIATPAASSAASRPTLPHRTRRRSAGPPRARRRVTPG